MRRFIAPLTLSAALIFALPAISKTQSSETPRGFTSTVKLRNAPATVKLDIHVSEDLAYRANNLPEKRILRGGVSYRSGFAQNGYLGDDAISRLTNRVESRFTKRLAKHGITVSDDAAVTLKITLNDAKPNRPTFTQMSRSPSLSHRSFGTGGAELQGELLTASGESAGGMSYKWYETDIRDAQYGSIWSDADRSIDRFAKRAAKALSE